MPAELRQSMAWDRGAELANHQDFTIATDLKVYFRDPQSPCQRGTYENSNRLLRQYFPKEWIFRSSPSASSKWSHSV